VAHVEGALDKPWKVWRAQDIDENAKQAVAFVESLSDEIYLKVPWAHETTEYCCHCDLKVGTELPESHFLANQVSQG
jgi:hypothetical protein